MSHSNVFSQASYQSSFSLPDLRNIPNEVDLGKTQDRKEKKKVQNREAQRTYRNRMKARREALEARLASEDAEASQSTDEAAITHLWSARTLSRSPGIAVGNKFLSVMESRQQQQQQQQQHLRNETSRSLVPQVSPLVDDQRRRASDDDVNSLLTYDKFSVESIECEDILTPSFESMRGNTRSRSNELFLDILSSQNELINRLDQIQQGMKEGDDVDKANKDAITLQNSGWGGKLPHLDRTFLKTNSQANLAFLGHPDHEPWAHDISISHVGETCLLSDSPTPQLTASSASQARTRIPDSDQCEFINWPTKSLSQSEQFESILEHTAKLGFEHFDLVAASYYIHEFNKSSFIANEQRMSRNRRLPAVLAQLFSATASWSEWERRGVHQEIIKIAESMLLSETKACNSALDEKILPLVDGCLKEPFPSTSTSTSTSAASAAVRGEIESGLPNFWTLVMALTEGNRGVKPNDRSKVATATILLLLYAGRMRKDQLLGLLGAFLV